MSGVRTAAAIINAIFTVGIYDRLGARKGEADFVDRVTATSKTILHSLKTQMPPPQPPQQS